MNLYMFSQQNNVEMGIYISREKDEALYDQVADEVERIKRACENKTSNLQKNNKHADNWTDNINSKKETKKKITPTGYCIRTGKEIPFNLEKPMSLESFKIWSKYEDPDYPENFCHFSGEPSDGDTCMRKPILPKNWKKAMETFDINPNTSVFW